MSSNGRPITQTWGYQARLKNGKADDEGATGHVNPDTSSPPPVSENRKKISNPMKLWFPKPNHEGNDVTVPSMPKDEKLARTFPNRSYHHLMTIKQARPAVIGVDDTDRRKRVAIKRVRKPEGSVHQVPPSTCDQIVNIKDMYVENGDVIFVYEQMDVSLRHMTGILQDRPLKLESLPDRGNLPRGKRQRPSIWSLLCSRTTGGERPPLHARRAWSGSWRAQLQHDPT